MIGSLLAGSVCRRSSRTCSGVTAVPLLPHAERAKVGKLGPQGGHPVGVGHARRNRPSATVQGDVDSGGALRRQEGAYRRAAASIHRGRARPVHGRWRSAPDRLLPPYAGRGAAGKKLRSRPVVLPRRAIPRGSARERLQVARDAPQVLVRHELGGVVERLEHRAEDDTMPVPPGLQVGDDIVLAPPSEARIRVLGRSAKAMPLSVSTVWIL